MKRGRVAERDGGEVAGWRSSRMEEWQGGGAAGLMMMARWRGGRMQEWQVAGVARWRSGRGEKLE